MADEPPPGAVANDAEDDVEYAIDGTEHSRDGYGNLVTVEEQREMLEEDAMLERSMKAMREEREAHVRAANPVAYSIPQAVYAAAAADPQQLSDTSRRLLLSRGDVYGRALASPQDLTRAERYKILGWPTPDVVEQRIRAATRPSGTELSTPAELFAKAERQGTETLTPVELHLLGHGFRLEGSQFEEDDFSDEEEEQKNKKVKGQASSLFDQLGVPGNHEAYDVAAKEEGVNLQIVAAVLMQEAQERQAESFVPGPAEAGGILDSIAERLLYIKNERRAKRMGRDDFDERFNNIVASIRGLSDRFTSSLPPGHQQLTQNYTRHTLLVPPPRHVLGPNPFGLRLSHDGSRVSAVAPYSIIDRKLPDWSTQVPPWTVWSTTIPHHMREPIQINIGFDDFIKSVQTWTEKEEQAWRDYRAAREVARETASQTGTKEEEEKEELPPFFNTPPSWPLGSSAKRPFIIYYESVRDTEDAKAWPNGEIQYAKHKWDLMIEDEQAVYAKLCEERRKQAWVDSIKFPGRLNI
ncbi:MAG: hypothetical protein STHCBS139747_004038 [Sporothrix thermara]